MARRQRGEWAGSLPVDTCTGPRRSFATPADLAFNRRAESVRKDVECVFGILKRRFRILMTGIPYQKKSMVDHVWFTVRRTRMLLTPYPPPCRPWARPWQQLLPGGGPRAPGAFRCGVG